MDDNNLKTKYVTQLFLTNPKEFSKLSSIDFEFLKDLILKINSESEQNDTKLDQINIIEISLDLIKAIVFNNFQSNFDNVFDLLIEKLINLIPSKPVRSNAIGVLLKTAEEEFISNEKYIENNQNLILKMDLFIDVDKMDIKDIIRSFRESCKTSGSGPMVTSNITQEGLINFQNKAYNFLLKMSKGENSTTRPQSKLSNGLFTKMVLKLYKESKGGEVIMNCLESDFKLPIIISENTDSKNLLEIIDYLKFKENNKGNFEKIEGLSTELRDVLLMVQIMKYFSLSVDSLEKMMVVCTSVVTGSYISFLTNLSYKKAQEIMDENGFNSNLEILTKFIPEVCSMLENLHMDKPLQVFATINILAFHKFIFEAKTHFSIEIQQLMHDNQNFLVLLRIVLQKFNSLINNASKESELNWQKDICLNNKLTTAELLASSSRNWLNLLLKDDSLQLIMFWLQNLHDTTVQIIGYLNEQNSLSSIMQVTAATDNILFVDDEDGPGEEYGLNHLFTDYHEKVRPSVSNTSLIRYDSKNDSQKLAVQFVNEIIKTISSLILNEDPIILNLVQNQFNNYVLQVVCTMANLLDQEIINFRDSCSASEINELIKLFVNFINLLFSFNIINRSRTIYLLSLVSVQLPIDYVIDESQKSMDLEMGPMMLLVMMNISIQYMNSFHESASSNTNWLKSDVFIKLMWKNMLYSIRRNFVNFDSKCVDVRQEFIQLFVFIFHGLSSRTAKNEIITDLLNCIAICSTNVSECQPRLLNRLLLILNYVIHYFYEQAPNLANQLQYNLLTKYISDPVNSDMCNYRYEELQLFDQKSDYIFYDVLVPWPIGKKVWPGPSPDSMVLKHITKSSQYECYFNGILNAIQICFDHRQIFESSQKNSTLCFANTFYNFMSCWRLLEILPLPEKYSNKLSFFKQGGDSIVKLLYNFLKLRHDAKSYFSALKNDYIDDSMLIERKIEKDVSVEFCLKSIVQLCVKLSSHFISDSKLEDWPQLIFQIDTMIISVNFILQCYKEDVDNIKDSEKSSIVSKCYLDRADIRDRYILSSELLPTILHIYKILINQLERFVFKNKDSGFVSLDLSPLTKANMESKLESVNIGSLKNLSCEIEKLIQKWTSKECSSESNGILFNQMKLYMSSKSFDSKFCNEHDNIIDMIRAESHRRFQFIVEHIKSNHIDRKNDVMKLILSTTMVTIEDLRDTFTLIDSHISESSIFPLETYSSYLNLVIINSINTLIPLTKLQTKTLKVIPSCIYSQVISRKLIDIFCDLNKSTITYDNSECYEVMQQSIECLINMVDGTSDGLCMQEIVSVLLEKGHSSGQNSRLFTIFTIIFNPDNMVLLNVKCSLLRLVNMILYRYKHTPKENEIYNELGSLHYGIHHIISEQINEEMVLHIENWINDILMDVKLIEETVKSDYLSNVLLFSQLLSVTTTNENDAKNLCNVITKSILHMDEKVRSWLIRYRNMVTPACGNIEKPALINLHIIIEMMCVLSYGNCPLSLYVNVIQTLLDWNKEINKSLSKHAEYKLPYGPHMELMCESLTIIYNHIGAVICALNTLYQTESCQLNSTDIIIDNIQPSSELYCNDFNMKQLSIDKKALEELLFCQIKYNQIGFEAENVICSESEEEKMIKLNPLDDQLCTFAATQKEFTDQHWYHCHTCSMVENEGVCTICAKVCHYGHDLTYAKRGSFFCDCGAKGTPFCEALTRRTNRKSSAKKAQFLTSQAAPGTEIVKKEKANSKNQFSEKSKCNFLSSMSKFSKFSSNEKLLRKSFKTDSKNRLSTSDTKIPKQCCDSNSNRLLRYSNFHRKVGTQNLGNTSTSINKSLDPFDNMGLSQIQYISKVNNANTDQNPTVGGSSVNNDKDPLISTNTISSSSSSSKDSNISSNTQESQKAYRFWITNVLRERVLKENETLTILLETSTLLDDCFSALQTIHTVFKLLYADWAVGKNTKLKEAFKSVKVNEKITERVTTIISEAPRFAGLIISETIKKSRTSNNQTETPLNKITTPMRPRPMVTTSRLEHGSLSQLIMHSIPAVSGLTTSDALSLVETYLLSELGVTGGNSSLVGRGQGLNRRLPIRGIPTSQTAQNQSDLNISNQQNTNIRSAGAVTPHSNKSVTEKSVTNRFDLGSSIQLRNTEAPSDMSGIPPTSVLASEIAGANSNVRGMLQSGYVRRNVLTVVFSNKGALGDQYFLAVAQDKARIMIYKISSLLEELYDATVLNECNGGIIEEKSIDLESKQGMIEQVCTITLQFTVLSMCTNPVNQQYMAVCGLKEVSVLVFTSMGSVSSKTSVQPILEDSNQFIIYSQWLPGFLTYLVLVLTQSVQIFDLSQSTTQPAYHFKSVESRFKSATFAFIQAKSIPGSKKSLSTKSECYILVMSESGCIHCKKLDKSCMASSGFYLAEMLDWNPEIYNMNRDLKTGVLGKGGASIHYDHNLQLLFHSYNNGRTFCSVLDSGHDEIYVDKNYCLDIKNDTDYDCTLVNWFSINDHPGLLTAICQQTNSPVYLSIEPDRYCYQILEKCDNNETDGSELSVTSLSKVTDAITFPWKTILDNKKKEQRTLSMVLFNDGRIKFLMANAKSSNTDGQFWLQERFVNSFLNDCLQGANDLRLLKYGYEKSRTTNPINRYSKHHTNKDVIFLDNQSCGRVPVDFFEYCEYTNEVSFSGDRFLELYSQDVLNLRMLSQEHSVSVTCKNPVTLIIANKKEDSVIVGVRIGINVGDTSKIPKYFEIYNRKIHTPEHITKNRIIDIGMYKSEILQNEKSLSLIIGPSKNANDVILIDYVKVFVRFKCTLPWLNEKQGFLRSKDIFAAKNSTKSQISVNMDNVNKCLTNIATNYNMNLSLTNPYLPKPELLASGLQLLTAFFHFKNTLNLESRPTFSSFELVTSSSIRMFANDILSSFYPSTILLNATTLLACVDSIKYIDADLEPRLRKSLIINIGQKLFNYCSDLIKKFKDEEPDPVNVLIVEATIIRLAHLIDVHRSWISIDEDKFSSLSYMDIFELMNSCIELISEYHEVCSLVRPEIGTDTEITILSNFIYPVYCQKLDHLPSLIPVIIKGLLCFNFVNMEDLTLISSDFKQSTICKVQLKLTDLLIKMLIDPNLSISHSTRRSLNYFMKICNKKSSDDYLEKKIDMKVQDSKKDQVKADLMEDAIEQQSREFETNAQYLLNTPAESEGVISLSILLPENQERTSHQNEPDEEEIEDREYYCRVDDEWMVAVSNSESNSLGGSTLANDPIHFFQQMEAEIVPVAEGGLQEMMENVDEQRILDYALRKSLEDQGGSSNDANNDDIVSANIEQVLQEDSVANTNDPMGSVANNNDEDQQSVDNIRPTADENWIINMISKKVSKQIENLSTPDRECSESNSESDNTTFGMIKSANDTSKLVTDNAERDFLICIQRFGIQFIERIIFQWPTLMESLNGTRAIALCKSMLDVLRYMDMRDEEAKTVVHKLISLMLDLILGDGTKKNLIALEYDTAEIRLQLQLICVILRTILNLILYGTVQTLASASSTKDDNNSTAVDAKSIPLSSVDETFSQDSVAYLTLKLIYERKVVAFCFENLDQLLNLLRSQSLDSQKSIKKENYASTKLLGNALNAYLNAEVFPGYYWLPVEDSDSLSDLHMLLTEILLRLPYAVLKLCRNTMKDIKTVSEEIIDGREFMTDLANNIQKESKWHSVLCEFIEVNINESITRSSRTLLNSVVGAKHYRAFRDIHLIEGSINKMKLLLKRNNANQNSVSRIRLSFDDTLKLLDLVESCINKAKERPSNWKLYCSKCPDILNFMMMNSVSLHQTIGMKLLYLLQLALLEPNSSKNIKKDTTPTGISGTTTSTITAKLDDKMNKKPSSSSAASSQINKQEAKLCRLLTTKMDSDVLTEFVKMYLCEHSDSGVRWLTEAVLSNLYNHGKHAFRSLLIETLADCWSMPSVSTQLADLTGHLIVQQPHWERLESFSMQLTNSITQSSRELLSNPCTSFYHCLQRFAKLPGYYLDPDPCISCFPPSAANEMRLFRWDSEPTDNRRNQAKAATIAGMGLHTASSSSNMNDYLTTNVRSNPTVHVFNLRAPYSIQSVTVKFSGTRRQRPQCGITLYYSDISTISTTKMLDQANLWQKVKTVNVSKDMAEVKLDFPVLLTAVYLIFEYDCYTGSLSNSDSIKCPRCHSASIQGNVCLNCRDNINQCFRCRAINYAGIDSFICANCSSCRYGRIDFSMMARPCYDFIEELKSEESREVMINRITTWSETVEKNSQEMVVLKQELELLLDQVKMVDAVEISNQRKLAAVSLLTGNTTSTGTGPAKLATSGGTGVSGGGGSGGGTGGKTYAEVSGGATMDDSGLQTKSYRRIRRPAGGENDADKEPVKTTSVSGGTFQEGGIAKEDKKEPGQMKHIHAALHQLIMRYSSDAKEQQLEISCLCRQLWAAKKAVANYDARLSRAKNPSDFVNELAVDSSQLVKQHCYTCLLSKLQLQIWFMKGLCFIPEIRKKLTNAAIQNDLSSLLLGQMLDAVSSGMRQEIIVLIVQITRDRKQEVTKLNQIITLELLKALKTHYLPTFQETRIKVMMSLLRSSVTCSDSLWELRLRPAIAVLIEASRSGPSSENCTKIVVAPCIALIQACMRFLGRVKHSAGVVKKQQISTASEPPEQFTEFKQSYNSSMLPVLNINQWLHDDGSLLFETWLQYTQREIRGYNNIQTPEPSQKINYLIQKFVVKCLNRVYKRKLFDKSGLNLVNVDNVQVSQAWLWQALLCPENQFCPQTTHLLVEMLAYQSVERHRIVLKLLVQCLPHMVSGVGANSTEMMKLFSVSEQAVSADIILPGFELTNNDASSHYVSLVKKLSQEKHWRCYLVIKCKIIALIDLAMSRVLNFLSETEEACLESWRHCQNRSGLTQGGWAAIHLLKSLAELLLHLQEIPTIAYRYRATIVRCLLTSSLNMRRLIVFRSKMTTDMESRFNKTVDNLSKDSEEFIRSFIKIAVHVLKKFPVTDLQSAGHIIEKINAYVCPRDYEHPVFDVVLDIFKGQEDFLPHRMIGVSLSSQSFGHNPNVNDVINFLVRENGVTSDIRLDLICDKKVLMYDLLLEDIYEHVWLSSDSNNKNRPMRLTVRISGLVEDNMPYVENLRKEVPMEHYQRSNELIDGGMHTIIQRLAAVDELAHGFSVISSSVRLLHYFIKVPDNDIRLIEPGMNTVKALLQCLLVCLRGGLDEKRMAEYEETTVIPLINLLCRILVLARVGTIDQQNHMKQQLNDLNAIPILLEYISSNCRIELYQKHVTRVPALLAFNYENKMSLILEKTVPYFQQLVPDSQFDENQKQMLHCCCNLMSSIPSDEYGTLFRHYMLEKGLLCICIDFLVAVAPVDALKDGTKLDFKRQDTTVFLEQSALQFVLILGQACVGSNGFAEAGQVLLNVPGLLGFLHKLETVKSVQAIGVLSEDWLNALKECSVDMNQAISGLRNNTQKILRAQALKVRQKQLNNMHMMVNDKGQVLTSSPALKDLSSQVLEEPGHCCDICLDGYVNKPQESLGVYTYVKKVLVHDLMSGKMVALPSSVSCANQYYYTSVSNYVCVHFSCHNQAVKVVNDNEWVTAQRHNQNAKCNSLMPILGPHHDNNFKSNLNRYQTSIWNNTNVPEITYQLMVHDLKFLLLRFAHNRSFNEDTGGGARLSNMRLVPQILQIAMANLLTQSDLISKEFQAISKWIEQASGVSGAGGPKIFTQNIWQATNTPYRAVQSILFCSREMWLQHRIQILKLMIQFAHIRHINLAEISLLQTSQLDPLPYSVYHPFLVFFGLIQSFYNILFKNVTSSPSTGKSWMDALSLYIRENDVTLLDLSNKLVHFYEDNLLPCESFQEFWDVADLGEWMLYEENYLSAVLMELKDIKQ